MREVARVQMILALEIYGHSFEFYPKYEKKKIYFQYIKRNKSVPLLVSFYVLKVDLFFFKIISEAEMIYHR